MKKRICLACTVLAILALAVLPAAAETGPTKVGPGPEPGMGYKFGRGAVNVLTCWTEIPRNVAIEWQRTDPASGFFLGVGKGLGYGYARLMGGIYDMVTFPFPVPMGYAPVMDPEFSAHNEYRERATGSEAIEPLTVEPAHEDSLAAYETGSTRQWP